MNYFSGCLETSGRALSSLNYKEMKEYDVNMPREWRSVAMVGIAIGIAYAQAEPVFEVSRAIAGGRGGAGNTEKVSRTPRRIAFQATQVGDIMAFAYGLPLGRIERRPQWMYDEFYNVSVATAAPAGLPEQKLLLQKLLEKRFGLVVHRVSYESPVYFLVCGPKVNLTETAEPDAEDIPEFRDEPLQPGLPAGRAVYGTHMSMGDLAAWLYPRLQLPVLDKTGITGLFDIEIPGFPGHGGAERIIQAVRNTLGLDLELHRGVAETLIIDSVEKPKE
jgi:uncharacterized protein (TIGR03435 family)